MYLSFDMVWYNRDDSGIAYKPYEDENWDVDIPGGQRYYSKEVIERNLVKQLAHEPHDEEQILQWRILRVRMENGWILESDDW